MYLILDLVPADPTRPTTVEAIVAAVKRESQHGLRSAILIMLMVLIGTIGLSVGYLMGVRDINPAAVEAAGTWFGALVTLAAVIIAARVFLSDKLYQDYQLASDARERDEEVQRDRRLLAEASLVDFEHHSMSALGDDESPWFYIYVTNWSHHTITQVRVGHPYWVAKAPDSDELDPGERKGWAISSGRGWLRLVPESDLDGLLLADITVTFIQNDHKWVKRGYKVPELVE
jgi:hypothetical protein